MKRDLWFAVISLMLMLVVSCMGIGGGGGYSPDDDSFEAKGDRAVESIVVESKWAGITNNYTIFYPADLNDDDGKQHGVIVWCNGFGGGTVEGVYDGLLAHFATHGFIVVQGNTSTPITQTFIIGMDIIEDFASDPDSIFYQELSNKFVLMGHSMGGGYATKAGSDNRVTAIAGIEPWEHTTRGFNGPILWLTGTEDTQLPPEEALQAFEATEVPTVVAILEGADHYEPVFSVGGGFRGILTAWLYDQLEDDPDAYTYLWGADCTLCNELGWEIKSK